MSETDATAYVVFTVAADVQAIDLSDVEIILVCADPDEAVRAAQEHSAVITTAPIHGFIPATTVA